MNLSIIRDGHRFPYSAEQLRKDHPNVSFPKDLTGVDLSEYGVVCEHVDFAPQRVQPKGHERVAMHRFLYGLREFGLRVQFERYILICEGHARDYWMSAPYVTRSSTYLKAASKHFGLSDSDLDLIFDTASSIEE